MKILKVLFASLLFIGLFVQYGAAQDSEDKDVMRTKFESRHQFGYTAATANGGGFTYRFTKGMGGISVSIAPIIAFSTENGGFLVDGFGRNQIGVNYNRYFFRRNAVDFSLLVGGELRTGSDFNDNWNSSFQFGVAPQIDLHLSDQLNWELHLGFGAYGIGGDSFSLLPTIGTALLYNLYY